jgi:hypothetical protein
MGDRCAFCATVMTKDKPTTESEVFRNRATEGVVRA